MRIDGREIGADHPCFVIAELSANHNQRLEVAVELVKKAHEAGADAVKVQLYTPDTMTLPVHDGDFYINSGLWAGVSLWELYSNTHMPWDFYPELKYVADSLGITLFPTVYDLTSLEFAEKHDPAAYKVASFEVGYWELVEAVAQTGRPTIISAGCATEPDLAYFDSLFEEGKLLLLQCTSQYPAAPDPGILDRLGETDPSGVSDHTPGIGFPILCAAAGADLVEKHFWLGAGECADREFSLTPVEFAVMVNGIRSVQECIGQLAQGQAEAQERAQEPAQGLPSPYTRSVRVSAPVRAGGVLTRENTRVVRPAGGADPRLYGGILGRIATRDLAVGAAVTSDDLK